LKDYITHISKDSSAKYLIYDYCCIT